MAHGHVSGLSEADRARRSRRQIDVPAAHKRTAIVDADRHASVVTDLNERAEWQGRMRRRHCRAIEPLAARRA